MKYSGVGLPKGGKQPGKDGIVECKVLPPRNLLADIVSIGVLLLIGAGAILAISDDLPKKDATRPLESAELNGQNVRQETVDVGPEPPNLELAIRTISTDASSILTQDPAIKGLPGSPYQPSLTSKPAPRRLGTELDVRGRHFHRQLSAVAQKPGHPLDKKGKWPKAFIMYLEAHRDLLRKILRQSETASPNTRE
jgi:hypothetical protein